MWYFYIQQIFSNFHTYFLISCSITLYSWFFFCTSKLTEIILTRSSCTYTSIITILHAFCDQLFRNRRWNRLLSPWNSLISWLLCFHSLLVSLLCSPLLSLFYQWILMESILFSLNFMPCFPELETLHSFMTE